MELQCTFLQKKPSICMSVYSMRPCVEFDSNGNQIKVCPYMEYKYLKGDLK